MLRFLAVSALLMGTFGFTQSDSLEDINFPLNSSIVVDGFQGLDLLASVMSKHDNLDLEVIGHTDSQGSSSYNKSLSERRAEAVKAYLVDKGANANKVKTSGAGISKAHDNSSREGRFQNRRVSLELFESNNGLRSRVTYPRLLDLFFENQPAAKMQVLEEIKEKSNKDGEKIMARLSDLQKQINAMNESLSRRLDNLEKSQASLTQKTEDLPQRASLAMQVGKYAGVSISGGTDDEGDFTGNLRGLYFRAFNDNVAFQAQGDAAYYEGRKEGQADVAAVFQKGAYKVAAAGSYKWLSMDHFESAKMAQAALIADVRFGSGKVGLFGTFPLLDGDVIRTVEHDIFTTEFYTAVAKQVGFDFGVSLGERVDFSGFFASVDSEVSDADTAAGLNLQVQLKDKLSFYADAQMNQSMLMMDDEYRYMVGLKLGSWNDARYNVSDQITPVNIPQIRYEILQRTMRTGNNGPTADAGPNQVDVAAGTVQLDGSASSDADGDELTYKWSQLSGPTVVINGENTANASFTGEAGNTYAFQLQVRDSYGDTSVDTVSIAMEAAPVPEPVIYNLLATPSTIDQGELSTLSWSTEHGDSVTLTGFDQVAPSGQIIVEPAETTTYTLTVTNDSGTATQDVTITVIPPPDQPAPVINFFSALPSEIEEGEVTTLSWSTEHADSVTLSPNLGRVGAQGSLVLSPETTTTYTLTAENAEGSVSAEVTITVTPVVVNNAPIADAGVDQQVQPDTVVTLNGSSSSDPDGDALTYEWTQTAGPSVSLTGADTATPSFTAMNRGDNYVFRLIVKDGRGGISSDEVAVNVADF